MIKINVRISSYTNNKEDINLNQNCSAIQNINDRGFTLTYQENDAVDKITYEDGILYINRKAKDSSNNMCFKNNLPSTFDIETQYGKMILDIYTLELMVNLDEIYIKYLIKNEEDTYHIIKIKHLQ